MELPTGPQTLSEEQVRELNAKLSKMRHDVNNHLSTIVAAVELIRYKPETSARMLDAIGDQPHKISAELRRFSEEFEKALGLTYGDPSL